MPLVEVNGAQVWVEDTGTPPGRPDAECVVFGHGLLFSGRSFTAQMERLRDRYRCLAIDWRGQGRSPASKSGYDMDSLYLDAVAIVEQQGLGPVHWVGLSMGGFIGMRLAARRPDLVRSLVLLDTSCGTEPEDNVPRYRMLTRVYGLVGMGPVRKPVERIMFGPTYLANPRSRAENDAWMAEVGACDKAGIKKAIYGVVDRLPVRDEIGRITAPTLVAVGADDAATPLPKSQEIVARIPGSRLVVFDGAGHSSSIEQPGAVADLLEEFIEGRPTSA